MYLKRLLIRRALIAVATEEQRIERRLQSDSAGQKEQELRSLIVDQAGHLISSLKMIESLEDPRSAWTSRGTPRDRK